MNTTLKILRWLGQSERAGLSTQADQMASDSTLGWDDTPGSYGRGSYAGHSTAALDFGAQGSFANRV